MSMQSMVGKAIVGAVFGVLAMGSGPEPAGADVPVENKTLPAVAHSSSWLNNSTTARAAFDNSRRTKWCPRGNPVGAWLALHLNQDVTWEEMPSVYTTIPMTLEIQVNGKSAGSFRFTGGRLSAARYRQQEGNKIKFIIRAVHGRGTPCISHVKMKVNDPDSGFYWKLKFKLSYQSWGAFAVNRSTGRWAYEILRSNKKVAGKLAVKVCGHGCDLITTWNKKCSAIVRVNRQVYFGYGKDQHTAKRKASQFCMKGLGVRACAMTTAWACSMTPR